MVEIDRYDPRKDKDALRELFEDFAENKAYFDVSWADFEKELNKRVLDLQLRNAMITAREDGQLVGWGTISFFNDIFGIERILIHQVLTKKEHSYKKGIEEAIIRELENYIQNTLKKDKVYILCMDSDSSLRSLLMKIGQKKSKHIWYEKNL